jgi:hypothetical protein
MGDGKRVGATPPFDWVAPDGCLCDAARPGWIVYKQGDGRTAIHDWGMEFTAAGVLMQSELLLISRDQTAILRYLPKLERSVNFIETRRDPTNNLFLAGPAGNLLAPSYAGWKKEDGTYGQAYLAGLSVTYIAALDRLIELEKMAGRSATAGLFTTRRDSAKKALARLTTEEGCLVRSIDPDGVRHGVYGAAKHGYFESSPNHDAVAFGVVDQQQAWRIYAKLSSIPELRPHDFIVPNYPSYDDMYEKAEGLWGYGTWVNGGHWSTCEARMILAYYRLEKFEDARRSMRRLLTFAEKFRMDNPLTKCGSEVYQPNQPINLCYDTLGPAAAFMRGLFEYRYDAAGLTLSPRLPPGITRLEQLDPVRFGAKQVFLSTRGSGGITGVKINGRTWRRFDNGSVFLPYDKTPDLAKIELRLGNAQVIASKPSGKSSPRGMPVILPKEEVPAEFAGLGKKAEVLKTFQVHLKQAGLGDSYEAAHARLAEQAIDAALLRRSLQQASLIKPLPVSSQTAADKSYIDTANKLYDGLETVLRSHAASTVSDRQRIHGLWNKSF